MKAKDGFLTEKINTDGLTGPCKYGMEGMVSGGIGAHTKYYEIPGAIH